MNFQTIALKASAPTDLTPACSAILWERSPDRDEYLLTVGAVSLCPTGFRVLAAMNFQTIALKASAPTNLTPYCNANLHDPSPDRDSITYTL